MCVTIYGRFFKHTLITAFRNTRQKEAAHQFPSEQLPISFTHIQNSISATAASLFLLSSLFSLCLSLRNYVVNWCYSCDNCFRISCDVDILILGDFKVFHTKRITNLHTSHINLDLVNQICRKCFLCNLFQLILQNT